MCETTVFRDFLEKSSNYTEKTSHEENNSIFLEEFLDANPQTLRGAINFTYSVKFENSTVKWASR